MTAAGKRPYSKQHLSSGKRNKSSFKVRPLHDVYHSRRVNDDVHSSIDICPVMAALIDTPPFQRLRHVMQLGTSSFVYPNTNHSRFEHSLGVAHLAAKISSRLRVQYPNLGCTEKDVLCVKLAGLLHDIGHGPFSHIYEKFIKGQRAREEASPQLRALYRNVPPLPCEQWKHETVSLMMIDFALAYIGLQIDLENLDGPLKQIGDGIDATTFRVFGTALSESEAIITSRDFVFIKECIWGGPIPEVVEIIGVNDYIGRLDPHKEFLYDIVSNRYSGLDVDKIDYFARDDRRANRGSGEIDQRILNESFVTWAKCTKSRGRCFRCQRPGASGKHLMICYPEKMSTAILDFFRFRSAMHTHVYQHKTVINVANQIMDILHEADPYFLISTHQEMTPKGLPKPAYNKLPISRAMYDPVAMMRLKDSSILDLIANTENPNLKTARIMIERLQARDLYKCVGTKNIAMDDEIEERLWKKSEEEIKREMLMIGGRHQNENDLLSYITLHEDDFIIEKSTIHYGLKEKNPLSQIRFLSKAKMSKLFGPVEKLPEAHEYKESEHLDELPRSFIKKRIFVISRKKSSADLASHVFSNWLSEIKDEIETTAIDDQNEYSVPTMLSQESAAESDLCYDDEDSHMDVNSPFGRRFPNTSTPRITPTRPRRI